MRLLHRDRTAASDDPRDDHRPTEEVRVAPAGPPAAAPSRPDGVVDVTPPDRRSVTDDGERDRERAMVDERDRRPDDRTMVHEAAPVANGDRTSTATVRERTWTFAPGQVVSFIAGVGVVAVGLIALLRAGVDGSLGTPSVDVLTYRHTAWLGVAEICLGLVLVVAGSGAWGRPLSVLLGAGSVIAGVVVLAEADQLPEELGLERAFGWPLIVLGAVVALAAMALPVWRRRTITDDEIVDLRAERRADDGHARV